MAQQQSPGVLVTQYPWPGMQQAGPMDYGPGRAAPPYVVAFPQPEPVPVQPATRPRRQLSAAASGVLTALAFLLVAGSGLLYYAKALHPSELHAQVTSVVQAVVTAQAQATTQAYATFTGRTPQEIYQMVTAKPASLQDSLAGQDSNVWVNYVADESACTFKAGAYHAASFLQSLFNLCLAEGTRFSNFAVSVRMTILQGSGGGLLLRADDKVYTFYRFIVLQDGSYGLYAMKNNSGEKLLVGRISRAIQTGLNVYNVLTVIAYGSAIYLYINGQYQDRLDDATASIGKIGVTAFNIALATEVSFSDLQVWTLT